MPFRVWPLWLSLVLPLAGQGLKCGSCHVRETNGQSQTAMAHALMLPQADPVFQTHPSMSVRKGAFTYRIDTGNGQTTYSVSDGVSTLSAPIQYVFGKHNQTYFLQYQGRQYESLVSFYVSRDGLDTTVGDQVIHPVTLEQAFGRVLRGGEGHDCAGCHSSVVNDGRIQSEPSGAVTGVACERCHSGAMEHQAAAIQGNREHLPVNLSLQPPAEINEVCGQCHRTWEAVLRGHKTGQLDNVRLQPYRLTNSKCFDGLDKRLSCVTCHDPHAPGLPSAATVDAKCLACHSTGAAVTAVEHEHAKICPTATSNCASCHMPKVMLMEGNIAFTDHEIRVVHPGDKYPN